MTMKQLFRVMFSGVVWFLLVSPTGAIAPQVEGEYDYGDAPDGVSAGYGNAVIGAFPSKEESNGARTAAVDEVWLGKKVNTETDSAQVDQDKFDDGVQPQFKSCKESKAVVLVHVKNPGVTSGTAYINLFADWNKDGSWGGSDECADEWAVRNFAVELSEQDNVIAAYVPKFVAGKKVKDIWWRATVTKDQRLTDETGAGIFDSGEVEDYGPALAPGNGGRYGVRCVPDPLIIKHGTAGRIRIVAKPGTRDFASIGFPNSVDPGGKGWYGNKSKRISIFDARSFVVRSRKKHVAPSETMYIPISVRYANKTRILKTCVAHIVHQSLAGADQKSHDYTLTEFDKSLVSFSSAGQDTTVMRTVLRIGDQETFPTEIISLQLSGMEIPLHQQNPSLPSPVDVDLNINGQGWPSDWQCELTTDADGNPVKRCQGTSTFITGQSIFDVHFNGSFSGPLSGPLSDSLLSAEGDTFEPLEQLHMHLLTADGQTLGVDIPVTN